MEALLSRIVQSYNEWDSLEEVVVGDPTGSCYDSDELGHKPKRRGTAKKNPFPIGLKPQATIEKAIIELEGLVKLLESQNVTVRRPSLFDFTTAIQTPAFSIPRQYGVTCPRDVMLTVGNEIIEATMSRRARYFEYMSYRSLIMEYWSLDPKLVWTVAPKPTMNDAMYRSGFWDLSLEDRYDRMHDFEFCINQNEVIFDAADIMRFGSDIFVQESMTTNRLGIHWLKRHLELRGLRVHAIHFPLDLFPSHLDCTFVPLRPGLILTNPDRPIKSGEERIFRDNGWEFVNAPRPSVSNEEMPEFCQSSNWLSMNILSLSPEKVIVEATEYELQKLLDSLGFEVLTLPFRNVYEFGGSFHCVTWDIRRGGIKEDYFPNQTYIPVDS